MRRENREIVLEIGHGGLPLAWPRKILSPEKEFYLGIENNPETAYGTKNFRTDPLTVYRQVQTRVGLIASGKRLIKALGSDAAQAVTADGRNLPLRNESVDRVHLHDVLNDPLTTRPGKLIHEVHRVLKPGGLLVVRERYGGDRLGNQERLLNKLFHEEKTAVDKFARLLKQNSREETLGDVIVFRKAPAD